jgi:hypothetical protein
MIGCIDYDTMLDVGVFYVDKKNELEKLPNLNKWGQEELANMNQINCGSQCYCQEDGEVYFLNGDNVWEMAK